MCVDVARKGKDCTIIHIWEGYDLIKRIEIDKAKLDEQAKTIKVLASEYNIDLYTHCIADEP